MMDRNAFVNAVAGPVRYAGPPTVQQTTTARESIAARTPEEQAQVAAASQAGDAARQQQISAVEAGGEAQAQGQAQVAGELDAQAHEADQHARAADNVHERYRQGAAELDGRINQYVDRLDQGLDSDRWAKSLSGVQKAGLLFAQALAGFGGALRAGAGQDPGKNPVVESIEQQIDADLTEQQSELSGIRDKLTGLRGERAQMGEARTQDLEDLNVMKAAALEASARRIDAIGARSQVEAVRAQATQAAGELRERAASVTTDALRQRFGVTQEQTQVTRRSGGMVGGAGRAAAGAAYDAVAREHREQQGQQAELQRRVQFEREKAAIASGQQSADVQRVAAAMRLHHDGTPIAPQEIPQVRSMVMAGQQVRRDATALQTELRAANPADYIALQVAQRTGTPPATGRAARIWARLNSMRQAAASNQKGPASEPDQRRINATIGSEASMIEMVNDNSALQQFIQDTDTNLNRNLSVYGLTPINDRAAARSFRPVGSQ